jgi:hypothetical protein
VEGPAVAAVPVVEVVPAGVAVRAAVVVRVVALVRVQAPVTVVALVRVRAGQERAREPLAPAQVLARAQPAMARRRVAAAPQAATTGFLREAPGFPREAARTAAA